AEQWLEVLACRGEDILIARRALAVPAALNEPVVLELPQPQGESRAWSAGADLDFVEPRYAETQLTEPEQSPPSSDDVKRVRDGADPGPDGPFGTISWLTRLRLVISLSRLWRHR